MKTTLRALGLAALAALTLQGCLFSGRSINSYQITENVMEVGTDIQNGGLKRSVSVENVISERRDGYLFVQARIQNEGWGEKKIEWSVEWYDGSGLLLGKPTAWEVLRLGAGEFETLRRTAPTPEAITMRLSVRPLDTVR